LGFPNPNNPLQVYPIGENHQNFTEFTPTAGLQYHFDPSLMAYLSYARGFKTGGWTTRLTAPLPAGSPAQAFGPETDQTYELGLKSEWLNKQLIVNAAIFHSLYDGIQLTYQISTSPVTQNAGDARIDGFELTTQSRLGDHFSLNSNVGFMHAYYSSVNPNAAAFTGPELPKTPKLKFSVSPDAHTALPNGAMVRVALDYSYTSHMFNDVQNTPLLGRPAVDMVNAFASITSPNGNIVLTIGGTNLSDARYVTTGQPQIAGGVIFGTYNPPREYYASLGLKY
jgi:iron complex outermembrane recepter protein